MNNLNSVLLEGNLVRDSLIRSTPRGTLVCNFTIATNRFFRQEAAFEKETGYFDVETWGRLAEVCGDKGRKGQGVRIVGRLRQDRWINSSGDNRSRIVVVAEHVEFRPQIKKADTQEELDLEAAEHEERESAPEMGACVA